MRRNTASGWVPGGMVTLAEPSSVGTSSVVPSTASVSGDGFLPQQVRTGALEARVAPRTHHHEQIPAMPPASGLGIPLPGMRSAMPSSTPCGIFTVSISSCSTSPLPRHFGQGCSMMLPRPWQAGQVVICWIRTCSFSSRRLRVRRPVPPHASHLRGAAPAFGACAVAGRAGGRAAQADFFLAAARHPLQGDEQLHLDVRAALRSGAPAVEKALERAAAAKVEIEPAENVFEIDAAEQVLLAEAGHAGESAGVVFGALLRVGQDRVGLGDFLEARLGSRLLVAVRVIFQGEIAESVLDRLLVGVLGNAEHFVVIALRGFGMMAS